MHGVQERHKFKSKEDSLYASCLFIHWNSKHAILHSVRRNVEMDKGVVKTQGCFEHPWDTSIG